MPLQGMALTECPLSACLLAWLVKALLEASFEEYHTDAQTDIFNSLGSCRCQKVRFRIKEATDVWYFVKASITSLI